MVIPEIIPNVLLLDVTVRISKDKDRRIVIIDFSKGFDTVPHIKLLSEIGDYGIGEPINNWLNMFLMNRKMK
jgi:hypothetical protein